ncbi:protein NEOXANTHIN-DEFICIENT 1 isoform X3 [Typha latifolia]|uniref:protein NEOXANTHIN-DEFICIENT 1 isoform X3 n=1 Tax=Typha latifolia TaxID=4733 RepID=UPI003C2F6B6A
MEGVKKFSSGYHLGPPWSFRGSALYQLHLVKAETARAFIPKEFKLVEAFGYTLGGLFLAEYDDSPAGKFDELVVIAGIKQRHVETMKKQFSRCSSFLSMLGVNPTYTKQEEHSEIEITEIKGSSQMSLCNISLPFSVPKSNKSDTWMGPRIRMSLPSFSGQTEHNPHLLKYSCQIECRVRAVKAAKVSNSRMSDLHESSQDNNTDCNLDTSLLAEDDAWKRSISILLSKPILALEFNLLKMQVGAPRIVVPGSKSRVTYANAS